MTKYLALVVLALGLLTGCLGIGGEQTSPREKLFIAEVTYEASLREVKSLVTTGFIRKDSPTAKTIATAIKEVRALLDQWQLSPDNTSYAILVAGASARLTTLLITLRKETMVDPITAVIIVFSGIQPIVDRPWRAAA